MDSAMGHELQLRGKGERGRTRSEIRLPDHEERWRMEFIVTPRDPRLIGRSLCCLLLAVAVEEFI